MKFALTQTAYSLIAYLIVVVIPFFLFCHSPIKRFLPWKVHGSKINYKHVRTELRLTGISYLVFFAVVFAMGNMIEHGQLVLLDSSEMPLWQLLLSLPLIVLTHDAYFYLTHLWMHKSKFMYKFHKNHHQSVDPTPLSVFAFHPVESFIHFIFFLVYPMIIPTSLEVLQFMSLWMLICNSAGHMPYEFYPKFLYDVPVLRHFNAATHHYMHHKFFNSNFGLYYNWWDKWFGTNHPEYFKTYQANKLRTAFALQDMEHIVNHQEEAFSNANFTAPAQSEASVTAET